MRALATSPESRLGPPVVGSIAPDFELPCAVGGSFRLYCHLAVGPVVLVFIRGHWCPYCRRYLRKLQEHRCRIEAGGARVIAISPEPPATSAALVDDLGLTFPVLADVGGRVIDQYGTRNGFVGVAGALPHASAFVIDRDGVVRFRSIDRNYKKRTTVRTILGVLAEMADRATPAS